MRLKSGFYGLVLFAVVSMQLSDDCTDLLQLAFPNFDPEEPVISIAVEPEVRAAAENARKAEVELKARDLRDEGYKNADRSLLDEAVTLAPANPYRRFDRAVISIALADDPAEIQDHVQAGLNAAWAGACGDDVGCTNAAAFAFITSLYFGLEHFEAHPELHERVRHRLCMQVAQSLKAGIGAYSTVVEDISQESGC